VIEQTSRSLRSTTKPKIQNSCSDATLVKCHKCRERKEKSKIVACINYLKCHHAFCFGCLDRYFKNETKREHIKTNGEGWVCFVCRGICKCEKCKLLLVKELSLINNELECEEPRNKKGNYYNNFCNKQF